MNAADSSCTKPCNVSFRKKSSTEEGTMRAGTFHEDGRNPVRVNPMGR